MTCFIIILSHCARKMPTLPPEGAVAHNNQGVAYLTQGDLDRAEFEFRTAIELNQKYPEAYNNLGIVHKLRGEYTKALKSFAKALEIDENYADPDDEIGAVYLAQGRLDDALSSIKTSLKKDPSSADANYNLGLVWAEKAKKENHPEFKENAEKAWKRATELNPNLDYVHIRMAEYYREKGDFDRAIIRYRLALSANPVADTWVRLGTLYLEKGDAFKAQNCFQKAAEVDPNSHEAVTKLGIFYLEQKRYDEAVTTFQGISAQNPFDEKAYFYIGTARLAQAETDPTQWKNAIAAFAKSKEINPNYSDATYNLGWAYLKTGDTLKAREEWQYTLVIDPHHAQTLYNLATLDHHQNLTADAIKHFCQFLASEKGRFPAEAKIAQQVLSQMNGSCN